MATPTLRMQLRYMHAQPPLRNTCTQQLPSGASVSGPYQWRDLSNCGVGRLRVAINCGVLSVKDPVQVH